MIDIDHVPTGTPPVGRPPSLTGTLLGPEHMTLLVQRHEVDLIAAVDDFEVGPVPCCSHLARLPKALKNSDHNNDRAPEHDDDAADQPNQSR
ncbi:hypothetical protein [Microlunatus phosphovorus]|uniref:hypothetical protein n=1 Tax=Microlunatus phosphovorus TaxID=29405 RepID=UPI0012EAF7A2|nr:hypothetical protein [Microlunatus phosphovorus]